MSKDGHRRITSILLFSAGACSSLVILFFLSFNQKRSFNDNLSSKYPNGFETKTVGVGNQLVAFSSDTMCGKPPIVYMIEKVKSDFIFEVNIEGVSCVINSKFEPMDVNGDGNSEVVSEWAGSNDGAGGLRGLIVWNLDRHKSPSPLAGYPEDVKSEESRNLKITITDVTTGRTYTFPTISDDFYTDYRSSDSGLKLDYGSFIWDFGASESRNSPHKWELQRFELVGDKFVKDASWHNGEKYTPEEKLSMENIEAKMKELFNSLEKI